MAVLPSAESATEAPFPAPMRPLTRFAVSDFFAQIGLSTRITMPVSMSFTGSDPKIGLT